MLFSLIRKRNGNHQEKHDSYAKYVKRIVVRIACFNCDTCGTYIYAGKGVATNSG